MLDNEIISKFCELNDRSYDYEKVMKEKGITQDDVDNLRDMALSSEFIPKALIDKMFLIFLVTCDNNLDKSLNLLHNYCRFKKETPEFFANRDVDSKEVQFCMDNQYYFELPPTPENYHLVFHKLITSEPKNYVFDDAEKTFLILVESCIVNDGPRDGVVFLWDMKGGRVGHVFQPKIRSIMKLMKLVQEGCPFEIKAIHVLNTMPILDMVLALFKPFIRSDIMDRVHFHSTNMDYEKFYSEVIPKSCLPKEYGGDLESVQDLQEKQRKKFAVMRDYFLMEERLMNMEFEEYNFDQYFTSTKM